MEEQRQIPPYRPGNISSQWYYCLECVHGLATEYSMRTHCRGVHEVEEPCVPDNFTNGTHLRILMERWNAYAEYLLSKFERSVGSLRGADDLAHEVGDGVPEESFPVLPKRGGIARLDPTTPEEMSRYEEEDDGA
jgi:hypothetical protein